MSKRMQKLKKKPKEIQIKVEVKCSTVKQSWLKLLCINIIIAAI